ncbi:MAG: hypothetical protein QF689_14785 [Candidatus Latescibacteria bacterium]|nr:hypothetical protein [Gemmatimonadaceae bacterium]MDP6015700.1 hypothetical protein [Candidatus Latescibacterota bacterium]MDP7449856.1 hypothetical protein [Candidatus Latescibacterota bacterium]HJP29002.1 hypothetical protein [Candidatus Latescibacterota bacterium]
MIDGLDRVARFGLATGVALLLQPWWADGFRYGFFVTIAFTLLHIVTSHLVDVDSGTTEA